MKGDFTRFTFRPEKQYTSVRLQQGRVQLDADWNEQVDIHAYQMQTAQRAFFNEAGAPKAHAGFKLGSDGAGGLILSVGHYYVGGLLCELHAEGDGVSIGYREQPFWPKPPLLNTLPSGHYLAYLDVWTRHVTALEDPLLREVALSGPDTTTRSQTIWQVKLLKLDAALPVLESASLPMRFPASTLRMAARARTLPAMASGALQPPNSGYLRLDNHLYRVEVHNGGVIGQDAVRFKWSRENGAIVVPWEKQSGNVITLGPLPQDPERGFAIQSWVELTDDGRELRGEPGLLCRVSAIEGPRITVQPPPGVTLDRAQFPLNPKVRRWDMVTPEAQAVTPGSWIELEDGLEVRFEGTTGKTGDYWLIPARSATRNIEWPRQGNEPALLSPHGITHYYADIATLYLDASGPRDILDRRLVFPSLVDLRNVDPQRYDQILVTHRHTGDADGSKIPREGIVDGAVNGAKIAGDADVQIAKLKVSGATEVTGALTVRSSVDIAANTIIRGTDISLDNVDRRSGGTGSNRRALVHESGDKLVINYNGDYSGGIKVNGNIDLLANSNPLHLASGWNGAWLSETSSVAICNDTASFKALMLVGNRGGVAGAARKVGVWDNLEVNGTLTTTSTASLGSHLNVYGSDFSLNNSSSRGSATGTTRRALVHASGDQLHINYGNDYSGDVYIDSDTSISGRDLRIDNSSRRGGRDGDYRRALVHDSSDTLTVNYGADYSSGVKLSGQLSMDGRLALANNLLHLRSGADLQHGLGYFGSTMPFAGSAVDGPVLYGYSGGALGTVQTAIADVAGSLYLTGGGYVDIPDFNEDFSSGISVEVWLRYDSLAQWSRVFDFGVGAPGDNILLANEGTTATVRFNLHNGTSTGASSSVFANSALATVTWIHIAATIDASGNGKLYKNGAQLGSTITGLARPTSVNRTNCYIGKSNWSSDAGYNGRIAHLRIWNRAISDDEVADHYSRSRPLKTTGLVGWWKLDEGSGTTARDSSGRGRHGTLIPGTTSSKFETYQKSALTWDSNNDVGVASSLTVGGSVSLKGTDLYLDNTTRRGTALSGLRRAMVHDTGDKLHLNYGGDYTGGTLIGSSTVINGHLRSGNNRTSVSVPQVPDR